MTRPDFITHEDIQRWDIHLEKEKDTIPLYIQQGIQLVLLKEVVYAGMWLGEKLLQLGCNEILISRICYTTGQLSFSRDPWEVAQDMLSAYQNNELEFEIDYNEDSTSQPN